jgi:hypothetical protein
VEASREGRSDDPRCHGWRTQLRPERILREGNGATRQLRGYGANRDVVEVTRDIAETTAALDAEPAA